MAKYRDEAYEEERVEKKKKKSLLQKVEIPIQQMPS